MKKILLLLFIPLFFSCTKNKSVTEKLSIDEVSKLINKDQDYEGIIEIVEIIRENFIKDDIVLLSKFKDLTYNDLLEYSKALEDSSFLTAIQLKAEKIQPLWTDSIINQYKNDVWKNFQSYKLENELKDPSKYFDVSFLELRQVPYESINEIKEVILKFSVSTKKGPIKGGSFNFDLIPKTSMKSIADMGCRFSKKINTSGKLVYTADYEVKEQLEWLKTEHVKEYYDFKFTILSVISSDGDTYTILDDAIPIEYKLYFDQDTIHQFAYMHIIESSYGIKDKSVSDFHSDFYDIESKKINSLAYNFLHIYTVKNPFKTPE